MRRLCRSITGIALVTALFGGCGSTGNEDALVLRFVRWDNTGLEQNDAVGEGSAQVDIQSDCCKLETNGTCLPENERLLTPTVISAVFRNEEANNIALQGYSVHVESLALAQLGHDEQLSTDIPGGHCGNSEGPTCAGDADCGTGTNCVHGETTLSGLVLFDAQAKLFALQAICGADLDCGTLDDDLQLLGRPFTITVTFFAKDDAGESFEIATHYVVSFDDLQTCGTTGGGGGA